MVSALSYLHQGCRRACTSGGEVGRTLSPNQWEIVRRLERFAESFAPQLHFASGRAKLKASKMDELVDLLVEKSPGMILDAAKAEGLSLDASRISYIDADDPGCFSYDPCEHLSVFHAACFLEPRLLRLGALRDPAAFGLPAVPFFDAKEEKEVIALARRWDARGKLMLAPARACPAAERHRLQPVPKDAEEDRLVHDRRWRNLQEERLEGAAKRLPSGALLVDFECDSSEEVLIDSDDLKHCYPSVSASASRALTNAVVGDFKGSSFNGTQALKKKVPQAGSRVRCRLPPRLTSRRHQCGRLDARGP